MRKKLSTLFIAMLMSVAINGCGQKGDLYKTENAPPPTMEEKAK